MNFSSSFSHLVISFLLFLFGGPEGTTWDAESEGSTDEPHGGDEARRGDGDGEWNDARRLRAMLLVIGNKVNLESIIERRRVLLMETRPKALHNPIRLWPRAPRKSSGDRVAHSLRDK